jgi:hypothetical protein
MKSWLVTASVFLSLFVFLDGAALAAVHKHHDATQLIKDKSDGRHEIDKHGKFHVATDMKGGKIAAFHVRHETKGDIPVKKYKTHKKPQTAQAIESPRFIYASYHLAQNTDLGTEWVGYSYIDDEGNEQIYWVPYDMVLDGDTGAVEYVPEN